MVITLYMDVHVPKAITVGLRLRGVDVITAQEDNAGELEDPELLDRLEIIAKVGEPEDLINRVQFLPL